MNPHQKPHLKWDVIKVAKWDGDFIMETEIVGHVYIAYGSNLSTMIEEHIAQLHGGDTLSPTLETCYNTDCVEHNFVTDVQWKKGKYVVTYAQEAYKKYIDGKFNSILDDLFPEGIE